MSDPLVSWNPPEGAEPQPVPVTDRDGNTLTDRYGEPLTVRGYLAEVPPPEAVRPVTYQYAPRFYADPRVDDVLTYLVKMRDMLAAITAGFGSLAPLITTLENRTMASYTDLKGAIDALTSNVDRHIADAKAHAAEQAAKLDELKNISDNGTEEEFQAAIDQIKAANDKLVADATAVPVPVPTPEPTPEPAPVEPAPVPTEPVAETPAEPSLPAPAAPAAEPASPDAPPAVDPATGLPVSF